MNVRLADQTYGKTNVRLTKVTRLADRHELAELSIDVLLTGDFSESYLAGDNRRVVATDTMKNTVYALAADHPLADPESFSLALAAHFTDRNPQVTSALASAELTPWRRIDTAARPHRHSFIGGGSDRRICSVEKRRDGATICAGIRGLPLLKTGDSAFYGFARDEFTTLPDTDDRIFATLLDATWTYSRGVRVDWNAAFAAVRAAMIAVFADHKSLAVQQTLFAMGQAALAACDAIGSIHLAMPNQHRIPFNLEPLGKPNKNEVFVTTSEPSGLITATIERSG
jgi:urate oxidase